MFNEVPVGNNTVYKYGDWKEYAIHDDNNIKGFFGNYKFLSNFELCNVWYEGGSYPSSENAYQAAKIYPEWRIDELMECSPMESKILWKKYVRMDKSAEEWDARKYDVMSVILFDKFYRNKDLRQKLIDTEDKYLEETLHWHDNYWGNCICEKCHIVTPNSEHWSGQNNLGIILMKIREFWK